MLMKFISIGFGRKLSSKIHIYMTALMLVTLSILSASLQAADLKIGFVDMQKVLEQAPQAEAAQNALQKEFSPRDKSIVDGQKELRKLEDKLTRDGVVMAESDRRKLERDIVSRKRDLKRDQDEFREDLNIRRNEILGRLDGIVRDAVDAIAKTEKYDLIVSQGPGVIHAAERIDITDKVIARLKQEFSKTTK